MRFTFMLTFGEASDLSTSFNKVSYYVPHDKSHCGVVVVEAVLVLVYSSLLGSGDAWLGR